MRISDNYGLRSGRLAGSRTGRAFYRGANTTTGLYTVGAYLQDNYTKGRIRLNLGVRWDYQNDEARAGCVEANPIVPDLLPDQCFEGADRVTSTSQRHLAANLGDV